MSLSHEHFLQAVREIVAEQVSAAEAERLRRVKLAYGFGRPGYRGITIYFRWANGQGPHDPDPFVEICAGSEESVVQLAGTTIHELGHALTGFGAGHAKEWRHACGRLGLRRMKARGTHYSWAMFAPAIRDAIIRLGAPTDGAPLNRAVVPHIANGRPCTAGVGTRGGRSRGVGSGSRLRKYVCAHGQIVRAATVELDATCNHCGAPFTIT